MIVTHFLTPMILIFATFWSELYGSMVKHFFFFDWFDL